MKKIMIAFVTACLLVCLIPSIGMIFAPTTETTENKRMADAPQLIKEDKLNTAFFDDFETYFTQHMALRNELLSADARIMSGLFGESNVSGVITGSEGWLYYSSTLDDYLGSSRMSEYELNALAWNLSVVQDYLEQRDIEFLFMIPPNKNSLYGEFMPYYDKAPVPLEEHNAVRLKPLLAGKGVAYCDLFEVFTAQDEVLYEKRDSHWNEAGAELVYDVTLTALQKEHPAYSPLEPVWSIHGDLNRMLYSFYGKKERVPSYEVPQSYEVVTPDATVESGWMETSAFSGSGKLLMFRDSFANTLIPLYSNVYAESYYSKGQPHMLEMYVEKYEPDTVILEKVERNIADYLNAPPILSAPAAEEPNRYTIPARPILESLEIAPVEESPSYIRISASVSAAYRSDGAQYVAVADGIAMKPYQMADGSIQFYLKKELEPETVKIFVRYEGVWYLARQE